MRNAIRKAATLALKHQEWQEKLFPLIQGQQKLRVILGKSLETPRYIAKTDHSGKKKSIFQILFKYEIYIGIS